MGRVMGRDGWATVFQGWKSRGRGDSCVLLMARKGGREGFTPAKKGSAPPPRNESGGGRHRVPRSQIHFSGITSLSVLAHGGKVGLGSGPILHTTRLVEAMQLHSVELRPTAQWQPSEHQALVFNVIKGCPGSQRRKAWQGNLV
jgi:hypothetical protein